MTGDLIPSADILCDIDYVDLSSAHHQSRVAMTATILTTVMATAMIRSESEHPNGLNDVLFVVSGTRIFFYFELSITIQTAATHFTP